MLVYVDDFLCVGEDEATTREACRLLEGLFAEFGLEWAPHKRRGPARCIEFLGLLVCNAPGMRCIGLTRKRQEKTEADLTRWLALRPGGEGRLEVDPTELAKLLGRLVFASQVIPGGRVFMMSMLRSFGAILDLFWSLKSSLCSQKGPLGSEAIFGRSRLRRPFSILV